MVSALFHTNIIFIMEVLDHIAVSNKLKIVQLNVIFLNNCKCSPFISLMWKSNSGIQLYSYKPVSLMRISVILNSSLGDSVSLL